MTSHFGALPSLVKSEMPRRPSTGPSLEIDLPNVKPVCFTFKRPKTSPLSTESIQLFTPLLEKLRNSSNKRVTFATSNVAERKLSSRSRKKHHNKSSLRPISGHPSRSLNAASSQSRSDCSSDSIVSSSISRIPRRIGTGPLHRPVVSHNIASGKSKIPRRSTQRLARITGHPKCSSDSSVQVMRPITGHHANGKMCSSDSSVYQSANSSVQPTTGVSPNQKRPITGHPNRKFSGSESVHQSDDSNRALCLSDQEMPTTSIPNELNDLLIQKRPITGHPNRKFSGSSVHQSDDSNQEMPTTSIPNESNDLLIHKRPISGHPNKKACSSDSSVQKTLRPLSSHPSRQKCLSDSSVLDDTVCTSATAAKDLRPVSGHPNRKNDLPVQKSLRPVSGHPNRKNDLPVQKSLRPVSGHPNRKNDLPVQKSLRPVSGHPNRKNDYSVRLRPITGHPNQSNEESSERLGHYTFDYIILDHYRFNIADCIARDIVRTCPNLAESGYLRTPKSVLEFPTQPNKQSRSVRGDKLKRSPGSRSIHQQYTRGSYIGPVQKPSKNDGPLDPMKFPLAPEHLYPRKKKAPKLGPDGKEKPVRYKIVIKTTAFSFVRYRLPIDSSDEEEEEEEEVKKKNEEPPVSVPTPTYQQGPTEASVVFDQSCYENKLPPKDMEHSETITSTFLSTMDTTDFDPDKVSKRISESPMLPSIEEPSSDEENEDTSVVEESDNGYYPSVGESHNTDPVVAESLGTDPLVVESHSTDPVVGESHSIDPVVGEDSYTAVAESLGTDPVIAESHSTDPVVGESHTAIAKSHSTDPVVGESHCTDPVVEESHSTDPVVEESYTAVAESHSTDPVIAESHSTDPVVGESHTAIAKSHSTDPVVGESHCTDPVVEESYTAVAESLGTDPVIAESHSTDPVVEESYTAVAESHSTDPVIAESHSTDPVVGESHTALAESIGTDPVAYIAESLGTDPIVGESYTAVAESLGTDPVVGESCSIDPFVGSESHSTDPVVGESYTAIAESLGRDPVIAESHSTDPVVGESHSTDLVVGESYTAVAESIGTDSVVGESHGTDPVVGESYTAVAESLGTDPVVVESHSTDPVVGESHGTDPVVGESYTAVAESLGTDPIVGESYTAVAESLGTDPVVVESHSTDPVVVESHSTDPVVGESHGTDPVVGESYTAVAESIGTDSVVGESHGTDPVVGESYTAVAESLGTDPIVGESHSTDPVVGEPYAESLITDPVVAESCTAVAESHNDDYFIDYIYIVGDDEAEQSIQCKADIERNIIIQDESLNTNEDELMSESSCTIYDEDYNGEVSSCESVGEIPRQINFIKEGSIADETVSKIVSDGITVEDIENVNYFDPNDVAAQESNEEHICLVEKPNEFNSHEDDIIIEPNECLPSTPKPSKFRRFIKRIKSKIRPFCCI